MVVFTLFEVIVNPERKMSNKRVDLKKIQELINGMNIRVCTFPWPFIYIIFWWSIRNLDDIEKIISKNCNISLFDWA